MVACPVTSIHASIGSLCVNSFGHLWVFYMRWQLKQIKCRDFFPLLGALSLLWSVFPSEVDIFISIPSPSFQVSAIALQEFDSFESLFWCYNCYSICWRMIDPLTDQFKNCSKKKKKKEMQRRQTALNRCIVTFSGRCTSGYTMRFQRGSQLWHRYNVHFLLKHKPSVTHWKCDCLASSTRL